MAAWMVEHWAASKVATSAVLRVDKRADWTVASKVAKRAVSLADPKVAR